jgi:hypothetical protein
MNMNKVLAVFAFLTLAAFLGVLVVHIHRIDLISVIVITLLLAAWDLYTTHKSKP